MLPETDFLLTVEGLTVSFDGFRAVDDLSSLSGPKRDPRHHRPERRGQDDGAGPDLRPHQGEQRVGQLQRPRMTQMKEHEIVRAGVGRKFQTPSIYEDLTVFENLEISFPRGRSVFRRAGLPPGCRSAGPGRGDRAATSSCADHLDQLAELLSHGQKQWLEIGMLLIQDPALMMLDEPVAGMSVSERKKTAELLHRVIQHRSVSGDRARHGFRRATLPTR